MLRDFKLQSRVVTSKPLKITGARENNLKNISFDVPHDELVVVTGLSGSGKSSLAFDTVYAEGQRRYIETFSPYVRQFLDKVKRPLIDSAESVRPAIAIQQRTRVLSSRSTVGSMTNVNDYLKLVWAGFAEPICPDCKTKITIWKAPAVAAIALESSQRNQTVLVGAKFDFAKRSFSGEKERLKSLGYSRIYDLNTKSVVPLEDAEAVHLTADKRMVIVLDRLKPGAVASAAKRISESVEQAFIVSGSCTLVSDEEIRDYSNTPLCSSCGKKIAKPRPALFSFNHPLGACADCKGFGKILSIDRDKVIPNPMLSLKEGALHCWTGEAAKKERSKLAAFCAAQSISMTTPWIELSREVQNLIFDHKSKDFRGVNAWFKMIEGKAYKMHVRVFLAKYRTPVDCAACGGMRFNKDALAYLIEGHTIAAAMQTPAGELYAWLNAYFEQRKRSLPRQVRDMFQATLARLKYLVDLGLEYLTLDRQSRTLSGGETQRVNLSTALGSELTSTHFVLDEPSVGLHARDTERLIKSVQALHQIGNSVMLVEHDLDVIRSGTQVLEVGPGAGKAGGEVVFLGATEQWGGIDLKAAMPALFARKLVASSPSASEHPGADSLSVKNANARNLKNLTFQIPLKKFVCLTGVSGSGKSTFVSEVLMRAAYQHKIGMPPETNNNLVEGLEKLDEVLFVDQSPLAKSPRANIATYTGMWDKVRDLLAGTNAAQSLALSKSSFSFNVDGGRCPNCSGAGFIREDMQFLSDVYIPCEHCLGKRFQNHVLSVKYHDRNAHELLALTVDEATEFFEHDSSISGPARTLGLLGLGHLTLGHSLSELSGGEAQRLKLVPYLQKRTGHNLFIFDEPTTGLHPYDIKKLVALFETVRDQGHSVLCIEHNLQLILSADWLIDLGPEGGDGGGRIMLEGSVADFLKKENEPKSETSRFLRRFVSDATTATKRTSRSSVSRTKSLNTAQSIDIYGARHHNLKNIDVSVPLEKLVALTGVSGSGKSSIAKDIIYAEGQRRYLDCLSPYARQFVQELTRPDIDHIENVKPAICVYQHTFQPGKLSTVGTMSEAYNFLRLLFAKIGVQHCPDHPKERIAPLSSQEIVLELKKIKATQVRLLAPIVKQKKGTHREILARAVAAEISQVRVDGVFLNPNTISVEGGLQKSKAHSIDYVLAKFNPETVPADLAAEVVAQGLTLSGGTLIALPNTGSEIIFSTDRTCPVCKRGFFKPDPEDLSFHSTRGRCEKCGGTGVNAKGLVCSTCDGSRLNALGRNVRLDGESIAALANLTSESLARRLTAYKWSNQESAVATPILRELSSRLETVSSVGLEYLPLNRDCATLSGGELQRLRLAAAMGSPLTGAIYIFDEPSAGLHPLDNEKVMKRITSVCDKGNSVIVIEHDPETIEKCEYVIEIGPGGGKDGGEVVFSDSVSRMVSEGQTPTADALRTKFKPKTASISSATSGEYVTVSSPGLHCVKPLSVTVPLKSLVTVCGVSGAGKSTFVNSILAQTAINGTESRGIISFDEHKLKTTLPLERVIYVDQQPIGANSRSTPASYLGIFDEIRKVFALSLEAKARGYEPSHFSYNTGKGRCPECGGLGVIKLEMNFLPDASVTCETCRGRRYRDEVESVLYQGISIADALRLTFEEAKSKFANHRKILGPVRLACDLGIGYLTLGQPSTTLSGGECQRIKLVSELWAQRAGHTLYILDEPTTGLHKADVARLMKALRELIVRGNSVIVIEHDPEVLLSSDYLIEFGPRAGGGEVVFSGTPLELVNKTPDTAWGGIIGRYVKMDKPQEDPQEDAVSLAENRTV